MSDFTGKATIYDYLKEVEIPDGTHTMTLANGTVIDFEMVNYTEDKTFESSEVVGNAIPDTTMLILKFHKNCAINKGVILTPQVRKKGFTIFVNGTLANNGTISMTQRGAKAEGQDVLIFGTEGDYHMIPAAGGAGGEKVGGISGVLDGNNGASGSNRGTGGGGGGGYRGNFAGVYAGGGSAGTSYSGGTGGGGNAFNDDPGNAQDGAENGGAGGLSFCRRTSANGWNATGGAGNPAGMDSWKDGGAGYGSHVTAVSESGTGGLLIIYTSILQNTGSIESNGSNSNILPNNPAQCATGGASGGGSVNIYANMSTVMTGTITADGGKAPNGDSAISRGIAKGGDGGDGCVSINAVSTRTTTKLVRQDKLGFILVKLSRVIREELVSMSNSLGQDINSLEEQIQSLASSTYWGDTVSTVDDLPATDKIGETHYVESISSYARWNGTKWVYISANVIAKVSETVDGILTHEDYVIFKNVASKATLYKDTSEIYENYEIKQLYNVINDIITNFYPKTCTRAVVTEEGESLDAILDRISKTETEILKRVEALEKQIGNNE